MEVFKLLKAAMVHPPVFTFSNVNKHFHVITDALKYGLEATFMQKNEKGRILSVQYASRTLRKTEHTLSTFEREAAAVILALKKLRHYLLSAAFTLYSDQLALKNALGKADMHGKLARWLDMMAKYEFEIRIVNGGQNKISTYLSRCLGGSDYRDEGEKLCINSVLVGHHPESTVLISSRDHSAC